MDLDKYKKWIICEEVESRYLEKSNVLSIRKMANYRVEELRIAMTVLNEYLELHGSEAKSTVSVIESVKSS